MGRSHVTYKQNNWLVFGHSRQSIDVAYVLLCYLRFARFSLTIQCLRGIVSPLSSAGKIAHITKSNISLETFFCLDQFYHISKIYACKSFVSAAFFDLDNNAHSTPLNELSIIFFLVSLDSFFYTFIERYR